MQGVHERIRPTGRHPAPCRGASGTSSKGGILDAVIAQAASNLRLRGRNLETCATSMPGAPCSTDCRMRRAVSWITAPSTHVGNNARSTSCSRPRRLLWLPLHRDPRPNPPRNATFLLHLRRADWAKTAVGSPGQRSSCSGRPAMFKGWRAETVPRKTSTRHCHTARARSVRHNASTADDDIDQTRLHRSACPRRCHGEPSMWNKWGTAWRSDLATPCGASTKGTT